MNQDFHIYINCEGRRIEEEITVIFTLTVCLLF